LRGMDFKSNSRSGKNFRAARRSGTEDEFHSAIDEFSGKRRKCQ
jgi:hypothetical protein